MRLILSIIFLNGKHYLRCPSIPKSCYSNSHISRVQGKVNLKMGMVPQREYFQVFGLEPKRVIDDAGENNVPCLETHPTIHERIEPSRG